MESAILEMAMNLGLPGLVFLIWYLDRKDFDKILKQYQADMNEQRRMYENNVELVKDYQGVSRDLKDVIILHTQICQQVNDNVINNQFCPLMREKGAAGK
jgi:spore maturation protein CgeB